MICLLVQDRVQALQEEQPARDTWRTAVIGKEAFQLWEFRTDKNGKCMQIRSTSLLSFSLEIESPGYQHFVRWLATDLRVGVSIFLVTEMSYLPACKPLMGPCHAAEFACEV